MLLLDVGTGATNDVATLGVNGSFLLIEKRTIDSRIWGSSALVGAASGTVNRLTKWSSVGAGIWAIGNTTITDNGTCTALFGQAGYASEISGGYELAPVLWYAGNRWSALDGFIGGLSTNTERLSTWGHSANILAYWKARGGLQTATCNNANVTITRFESATTGFDETTPTYDTQRHSPGYGTNINSTVVASGVVVTFDFDTYLDGAVYRVMHNRITGVESFRPVVLWTPAGSGFPTNIKVTISASSDGTATSSTVFTDYIVYDGPAVWKEYKWVGPVATVGGSAAKWIRRVKFEFTMDVVIHTDNGRVSYLGLLSNYPTELHAPSIIAQNRWNADQIFVQARSLKWEPAGSTGPWNAKAHIFGQAGNLYLQAPFSGGDVILGWDKAGTVTNVIAGAYESTLHKLRPVSLTEDVQLGDTTYYWNGLFTKGTIEMKRAAGQPYLYGYATGDNYARLTFHFDNSAIQFGPGNVIWDTNLYRSAANTLRTDDTFIVGSTAAGFTFQAGLGDGGGAYIGVASIGHSGSGYPYIGYGFVGTAVGGVYNYWFSDYAAAWEMGPSGAITSKHANTGTVSTPITWVSRLVIPRTGNVTIDGSAILTSSVATGYVSAAGTDTVNNLTKWSAVGSGAYAITNSSIKDTGTMVIFGWDKSGAVTDIIAGAYESSLHKFRPFSVAENVQLGDGTYQWNGLFSKGTLEINRAAGQAYLTGFVTGDTFVRMALMVDNSSIEFGSGAAIRDTNLYRSAADTLKTDDAFIVGSTLGGAVFQAGLGNGGGALIGLASIGHAGSGYPLLGFGFVTTAAGVFNYYINNYAAAWQMGPTGGITSFHADTGIAGNPITWTARLAIPRTGSVTIDGSAILTSASLSGVVSAASGTVNTLTKWSNVTSGSWAIINSTIADNGACVTFGSLTPYATEISGGYELAPLAWYAGTRWSMIDGFIGGLGTNAARYNTWGHSNNFLANWVARGGTLTTSSNTAGVTISEPNDCTTGLLAAVSGYNVVRHAPTSGTGFASTVVATGAVVTMDFDTVVDATMWHQLHARPTGNESYRPIIYCQPSAGANPTAVKITISGGDGTIGPSAVFTDYVIFDGAIIWKDNKWVGPIHAIGSSSAKWIRRVKFEFTIDVINSPDICRMTYLGLMSNMPGNVAVPNILVRNRWGNDQIFKHNISIQWEPTSSPGPWAALPHVYGNANFLYLQAPHPGGRIFMGWDKAGALVYPITGIYESTLHKFRPNSLAEDIQLGDGTYYWNGLFTKGNIEMKRTLGSSYMTGYVSGDSQMRFAIQVTNGVIEWGDGASGRDTNLYRQAANTLQTDDIFNVNTTAAGIVFTAGNSNGSGGRIGLLAMGHAGSNYPLVGYGFVPTITNGVYNYATTDYTAAWEMGALGAISSKHATNGSTGLPITFTTRLVIPLSGAVTIDGNSIFTVPSNISANTVYAGPSVGPGAGTPSFRSLVAADIPALSYLPLSGGTLTGALTIDASANSLRATNGLSAGTHFLVCIADPATVTRVIYNRTAAQVLGDIGALGAFSNISANTVYAGATSGGATTPAFRSLVAADIPALPYAPVFGSVAQNSVYAGLTSGSGTPAFRALVAADIPALAYMPAFGSVTQNFVYAGLTSGSGVPAFRALVAADIPSLSYLPLAGGTLSGALTINASGNGLRATNPAIAATHFAVFTGLPTSTTQIIYHRTAAEVLGDIAALPLAGGTLTGDLILNGGNVRVLSGRASYAHWTNAASAFAALLMSSGTSAILNCNNNTATLDIWATTTTLGGQLNVNPTSSQYAAQINDPNGTLSSAIRWYRAGGAANEKNAYLYASGTGMFMALGDDTPSAPTGVIGFTRTGAAAQVVYLTAVQILAQGLFIPTRMQLPIATAASPPTSPAQGNCYFEVATNKLWVYNGTAWKGTVLA